MIVDLSELPNATFNSLSNVYHGLMPKKFFRAKSAYVDRKLNKEEINTWKQEILNSPKKYLVLFDLQGDAPNNKKCTDTALAHRHGSLYSIKLIGNYHENSLKEVDENWSETYFQRIANLLGPESFQNYIDAKVGSPEKYYAENYERLKQIKAKYDRKNWFQYR